MNLLAKLLAVCATGVISSLKVLCFVRTTPKYQVKQKNLPGTGSLTNEVHCSDSLDRL